MTLSVTAVLNQAYPPRVLVSVSSSPSVTAVLRVYRVHEDGSQNRVLTNGRAVLNGTWSGYDYHAPFNQSVTYVASTGLEPDSAPSAPVFVPSDQVWLMHPSEPDLSFPVVVMKSGSRSRKDTSAGYEILNSGKTVRRTTGPRGPEKGDITVLLEDLAEVDTAEALLESSSPILLNSPRPEVVRSKWVQPGDWSIGPAAGDYYRSDLRALSFSWEECVAPDTDVAPVWTYADLTAEFAGAYTTLSGVWANYSNMNLDLRA